MAPRPKKDPSLPLNLWPEQHGGYTVYRYRNPVSGKRTRLGSNRAAAIAAARKLNAQLQPSDALAAWLDVYEREILPTRRHRRTGEPYSETTQREHRRMLRHVRHALGHVETRDVTRRQVADFLAQYPTRASNRYRTLLASVFRHAVARGWSDENPVAGTIPQTEVTERQRLTQADYDAIHEAAPEWYRRALEGAVLTLQPRQVLVGLRFYDVQDGWLYAVRGKTRRQGRGHVRIRLTDEIEAWLARCRDGVLSPYVIHRAPARRRRAYLAGKGHWTQVEAAMLSREFQRLRDAVGVQADRPARERPSFHELRALGADRYRERGVPESAIQALLGHADARQTAEYLDGHGVRWEDADLSSFSP